MAVSTTTEKKKTTNKKKPVIRLSSNKDYPIAKSFRDQVDAGRMSPDEAIRRLKDGGMKIDFLRKMFYKYNSDLLGMKIQKKKNIDKKIRTVKPRALANKGGMMKKKTKYMAKGGMKKTKYMAKGGMKKTKGYARGGAARRR